MNDAMTLLHLGGRWLAIDRAGLRLVEDFPKTDGPAWVLEDFADAPAGAMRLLGKQAHAPALIERKVRADGLVDGESRILIHRRSKAAGGMQVLYTAVPLPVWQKVMGWASGGKDHCLVLPVTALLAAGVKAGEGRVVRNGRQFLFFAQTADGFAYAAVNAYSDAADDLSVAARSLGEQARAGTGVRAGEPPLRVTWCPLFGGAEDERLMRLFSDAAGCSSESAPLSPLPVQGGKSVQAGLPFLLEQRGTGMAANPFLERLAAGAERALPLSAMAAAVIAAGFFVAGAFLHWKAGEAASALRQLDQQAEQREQAARVLEGKTVPAGFPDIQSFVGKLSAHDAAYNPYQALSALRTAAGNDVRILRVRLETQQADGRPTGLVADGALRDGADSAALTGFLLRLRTAGYSVTPLDPADGGKGGGFTYRLANKEKAS
jgi:hypothetical protein